jgi:hypothetical protein
MRFFLCAVGVAAPLMMGFTSAVASAFAGLEDPPSGWQHPEQQLQGWTGRDPSEVFACLPPHDGYPFCNTSALIEDRVRDLVSRIDNAIKPNLLTARGHGGDGSHLQNISELGVPGYYWGTNCLHSLNQVGARFRALNRHVMQALVHVCTLSRPKRGNAAHPHPKAISQLQHRA